MVPDLFPYPLLQEVELPVLSEEMEWIPLTLRSVSSNTVKSITFTHTCDDLDAEFLLQLWASLDLDDLLVSDRHFQNLERLSFTFWYNFEDDTEAETWFSSLRSLFPKCAKRSITIEARLA